MNPIYYCSFFAALFGSSVLASEDLPDASSGIAESRFHEEIIVTANRVPQPLADVLSVSTVITRDDIERFQARDIFDLLSREAGVSFSRNGGRGAATSLSLRGNQSDHTLFLIDGIRVGSATLGTINISSINVDSVERVEIVRGGKSALYGADAIGGIVNIVTRQGSSKPGVSGQYDLGFGSDQTTDIRIAGDANLGDTNISASVSSFSTNGNDFTLDQTGVNGDDDGLESFAGRVNISHVFSKRVDGDLSFQVNNSETDFDSACSLLGSNPRIAVDCDIFSETTVASLAGNLEYAVNDFYQSRVQLGYSLDNSEQFARNIDINTTINGGIFDTTKTEATWLNFLGSDDNRVILGVDFLLDEVDSTTAFDENSRHNYALFANWSSGYDAYSWSLGVRHDENEQFGGATTLSAEAGYQIDDLTRVVASYREGFKAPTFNDLFFPNFGNPNFVPEESEGFELAILRESSAGRAYVAIFRDNIENLILFNQSTFVVDQISQAEIVGLEFDVDYQSGTWLWGLSGSVLDPHNPDTGLVLPRRSSESLSIDMDKHFGKFDIGASFRVEGSRFDDTNNNVPLGGYGLTDLRLSYAVNSDLELKFQVNNIFDKSFVQAVDFSLGPYQSIGSELFFQISYRPK